MAKVSFFNSRKHAVHISGKTIMPGQTREVEESDVPGFKPEQEKETVTVSEILKLLDQSVPNFTVAIQEPNHVGEKIVSDAELNELEAAENNGNTRKGVIEAITAERLARGQEAMRVDEIAKYRDSIAAMDEDMLANELESQKDNPDFLAVVNEVIEDLTTNE